MGRKEITPTALRLAEVKEARDERIYQEKRDAAGFISDTDYDTWLVLEELRALTLAERRAAHENVKPPRPPTTVTINGTVLDQTLGIRGPVGGI